MGHVLESTQAKPKKKRSRRRKLLIWLLVDLTVAATVVALLFYRPSRYRPAVMTDGDPNGQAIHPYLHRDLASQFYNNLQDRQPFAMTVHDSLLNEAIGLLKWPRESDGVTFSKPEVLFVPGRVVLMGTASVEGADFVVTIELVPEFDEAGRFNISVEKVSVGAMNITPLAKMVGRRMYLQRLEEMPSGPEDLRMKIAGSLLIDKPFDPVEKVEDKWVRLTDVNLVKGELAAHFAPTSKLPASD